MHRAEQPKEGGSALCITLDTFSRFCAFSFVRFVSRPSDVYYFLSCMLILVASKNQYPATLVSTFVCVCVFFNRCSGRADVPTKQSAACFRNLVKSNLVLFQLSLAACDALRFTKTRTGGTGIGYFYELALSHTGRCSRSVFYPHSSWCCSLQGRLEVNNFAV